MENLAGAGRGGPRVRGGQPRRHAWSTSWSRSRWSPTPTRSRTSPRTARTAPAGRGHPDDPAHRQGPGVPGRVPHRARGRRLPAPALARRPDRAGGGAPAGLRRHHPGPQRLYLSRATVRSAWGAPQSNPASRFLEEIPDELVDWRRLESSVSSIAGGGGGRGPARRPVTGQPGRRAPRAGRPGHPRHVRAGLGGRRRGLGERAVASVDFRTGGVKRLLLRYAPVEKL